jgi:hypothetical protein
LGGLFCWLRSRSFPVAFARSLRKDIGGFEVWAANSERRADAQVMGAVEDPIWARDIGTAEGSLEEEVAEIVPRKIPRHADFAAQELAPSMEAIVKEWP